MIRQAQVSAPGRRRRDVHLKIPVTRLQEGPAGSPQ